MYYLTAPVVAKVIRLQPTQWSVAPSLAFTLIGERFASFNRECYCCLFVSFLFPFAFCFIVVIFFVMSHLLIAK